jgi:hypothetical protein
MENQASYMAGYLLFGVLVRMDIYHHTYKADDFPISYKSLEDTGGFKNYFIELILVMKPKGMLDTIAHVHGYLLPGIKIQISLLKNCSLCSIGYPLYHMCDISLQRILLLLLPDHEKKLPAPACC